MTISYGFRSGERLSRFDVVCSGDFIRLMLDLFFVALFCVSHG